MIKFENKRITADAYVRRKSDGLTAKAIAAVSYNPDDYEEVTELPKVIDPVAYNDRVNSLIRERYSLSEELSILRQRDTKPDEFAAYNAYAEQCKAYAKTLMEIGEELNEISTQT